MHRLLATASFQKPTLTVSEFVSAFNISRAALYKRWRMGYGPPRVKVGTRTLIPTEAALDWLESLSITPSGDSKTDRDALLRSAPNG